MRATNRLIVCVSFLLLFFGVSEARLVRTWQPDELEPKASLICNGTVISIEDAGIKLDFSDLHASSPVSYEKVMLAKIKVLHVFKGEAPTVIEFRYRATIQKKNEKSGGAGPEQVHLMKDGRYRFFLKPDAVRGGYVSVLDDELDDVDAVEGLWPHESDDSPYLTKREALKIAADYAQAKKTGSTFIWGDAGVDCYPDSPGGTTWSVGHFTLYNPLLGHSSEDYAQIVVRGDRTVDDAHSNLKGN